MDEQNELRAHVLELLEGKFAHIDVESALGRFPIEKINATIENFPHTAWQLLEHIRIAQWDILEFSRDDKHESPEFPDGYWNLTEGTKKDWQNSVAEVLKNLQEMRDLISDGKNDLFKKIPHGDGQTLLREALLTADHNAYHLGQIMVLEKIFAE
jgi:hypothetical protein